MNTDRLLALAERIERTPHIAAVGWTHEREPIVGFNMVRWHCGTVACIGGTADEMFGVDPDTNDEETTANALDLRIEDANRLFYPDVFERLPAGRSMESVTSQEAALVIRNLVDTGKVDWSIIEEVSPPTVARAIADHQARAK